MSNGDISSEVERFPPGTRVRLNDGSFVFLVVAGGYVSEDNWQFHSSDRPMTSVDFERVDPSESTETSVFYDEDTMMRVGESIREVVGDDFTKITEIVGAMQNRGILFRERCR